jgi:phytol kinase
LNIDDLIGAGILLAYYLVACALLPTILKGWWGVPRELVRKLQHVTYSLSVFLLLKLFSTWFIAVAAAGLLILVAYPALLILERLPSYQRLFVDRTTRGGELRRQLIYVQVTFAILIFIYWGLLGTNWQYVVAVAVMGWGFGDAAAALVGKTFGRRRVLHKYIEGAKTYEGTIAMILVAGFAMFFTMLLYGQQTWYVSLIIALLVAPVSGVVELFSRKGTDTFTVPLSTAALTMPLIYLFSLIPW